MTDLWAMTGLYGAYYPLWEFYLAIVLLAVVGACLVYNNWTPLHPEHIECPLPDMQAIDRSEWTAEMERPVPSIKPATKTGLLLDLDEIPRFSPEFALEPGESKYPDTPWRTCDD